MTPMMQQYSEIKSRHEDCILFYRLGDFYEMFFEDAITASRELEITLTGRNCGEEEKAPMCGVPFHACDGYIAKLIEKGYKVAVCEQVEDAAEAKGIVKRDVTRIITPGTVVNQTMLNEKENNYLGAVYFGETGTGVAFCDVSTGEIKVTEISGYMMYERVINEIVKMKPKEILIHETDENTNELLQKFKKEIQLVTDTFFTMKNHTYFAYSAGEKLILSQFKVKALIGIGLVDKTAAVSALGALLSYLVETQKQSMAHISYLQVYDSNNHMSLDKATIKNLELTETLFEKKIQGSLLGVLDKAQTAMGSRKLKQWLKEPLHSIKEINARLDAVETLADDVLQRNNIREHLKNVYDLERLSGRIACGNANGRDLIALRNSIATLPDIKNELSGSESDLLKSLCEQIDDLQEVCELINNAVKEEPPYTIKEGGIINDGFSEELDNIKHSISDGQKWIAGLEASEKERTGIKSLKVGFTKVFGNYIEVTKSYYDLVPDNYIRKQTLANCERFITQELKEVETVVLNAETKINQLEYEIFLELRKQLQDYIPAIQKTSSAIASVDVLCSFAEVGSKLGYVKPAMDDGEVIHIKNGRHPVIEMTIRDGIFVANDTYIDGKGDSMLLITGPNMAGKSTYMRQTALIVLMAQIGSFVPADSAHIGVVDRIYTRIGSSDNLSQGQSTFFVEMSELAYILNTATPKSLIVLDEIGRGTSTYDGLSIAWAVVEHLCRSKNRTKALFATHYHELTSIEGIEGVKNLNVDVQDHQGHIVFLHKIVEGSASQSYGIHVAKLAGVPEAVLQMAEDNLIHLEKDKAVQLEVNNVDKVTKFDKYCEKPQLPKPKASSDQISFFDLDHPVLEKLKQINLMETTPLQAYEILENLKKLLK